MRHGDLCLFLDEFALDALIHSALVNDDLFDLYELPHLVSWLYGPDPGGIGLFTEEVTAPAHLPQCDVPAESDVWLILQEVLLPRIVVDLHV